ncbi:MAG: hypothetical protein ACI35S_03615, partial [Anaeroplasma sp.]
INPLKRRHLFKTENIMEKINVKLKQISLDRFEASRSAWNKAVSKYMYMIVNHLDDKSWDEFLSNSNEYCVKNLQTFLLNGARDWYQYSWGGCALIYDVDIAQTLAPKSQWNKKKPNAHEQWLDAQARALHQAYLNINILFRSLINKTK